MDGSDWVHCLSNYKIELYVSKEEAMQNIIIREATPEDATACMEHSRKVGAETDNLSFGADGFPVTLEGEKEYIKIMNGAPRSVLYVAVRGDEVVGTVSLNGLPRRMSHRAELGITVLMSEWGKGLGNRLMEAAIDYAKNSGIEIIELAVRSDNYRAIRLYEKCNFKEIGVYKSYFKIDEKYVDFKLMNLYLI